MSVSPADHKEHEVELHRRLASGYRLRYGPSFAREFQSFWNEELLSLLPARIEAPALDNGCGTGILLQDLTARCEEVHGLDLSPEMLAQARERAPGVASLRAGDLESLPYDDSFFRTVICRGSLHHVSSHRRALTEIRRVLVPGGWLALTEPSDDCPPVRWSRAVMYRFSSKFDENDRAFRRKQLQRLLEESGFGEISFKRFGYLSYMFCGFPDVLPVILHVPGKLAVTRTLIALDRRLSRIPGVRLAAFHLMAVARKPG